MILDGKILIIDDELGPREAMRMILKDRYTIATASSGKEGIEYISKNPSDLVILDIKMPDMDGISVLKEIKKEQSDIEVVMVTAYASLETARNAIRFGANDYLIKPFDKNDVLNVVERSLSKRAKTKKDKSEFDELVVTKKQLEDVVDERTKKLTISEQRYKELFENAHDGIAVLDENGIIIDVNQKFCELHGFEKDALTGTNFGLLEVEDVRGEKESRIERILQGESFVYESEHYRKDGSRILLEISSKAIDIDGALYIQSFHRDMTDKKKLQEQLFQSQKMESIGLLAGGIAHDFNNILLAILGHAELLSEFSDINEAAKQKVKVIENSARKAGQLVSKLLSFARQRKFEILHINLNDVIKDSVQLLERTLSHKSIEVTLHMDNNISLISGDNTQIEQVIMNLVVNAADAMPNGGSIMISTYALNLENGASHVHPLLTSGKYVALKIADTGIGIPEEIKDKIFDPFFTTKATGKGTGLGLAMVYGIIKDHKGAINLYSQLGKGTTFEIYLPAVDAVKEVIEKPVLPAIVGQGKILVIDDEKDVLSYTKEVLEVHGYNVLTTDNPVYALDIFKDISDGIDLVITDIVMPLINGRELISNIKAIKPNIKIIAISGYDTVKVKENHVINSFINKPFESDYLLKTVKKVLDSEGTAII